MRQRSIMYAIILLLLPIFLSGCEPKQLSKLPAYCPNWQMILGGVDTLPIITLDYALPENELPNAIREADRQRTLW